MNDKHKLDVVQIMLRVCVVMGTLLGHYRDECLLWECLSTCTCMYMYVYDKINR